MRLRSLVEAWDKFFFVPQSTTPIALFRFLYGLLVIATILLLRPDWLSWYGTHAWVSLPTVLKAEPGTRLNLFAFLPESDAWITALFWVFLGSAGLLAIGFLTRLNSLIVFLCLTSIQQRNLYITHGGDTFLRIAGFFLIFAPAGAALSVDRLIRIWRGKQDATSQRRSPWAQRMIQFELSILYFASFCWKVEGAPWRQGTALYYVYHLAGLQRFPVPSWFLHPAVLRIGSWSAVALELCLGLLIWVKELRYILLGVGLLFHLWLEYSLNIPLFEWDVLSAYVLFVDPVDIARIWGWVRFRVAGFLGGPLTVIYDGDAKQLGRIANLLRATDVFGRLSLADLRDSPSSGDAALETGRGRLVVATPSGLRSGPDAVEVMARVVPLLWPLALLAVFRRWRRLGLAEDRPTN